MSAADHEQPEPILVCGCSIAHIHVQLETSSAKLLGDSGMLSALTQRLFQTKTFEQVIGAILRDTIAFLGAEYGNVQLSMEGDLVIVAQHGLTEPFLRTFKRVKKDDGCACGRALRLRQPVVIRDVERDADFAKFLKDARTAGFRAVQSTPLATRDDLFLGIVSTHFANVHEPTPIELRILETYSVVAAEHAFQLLGNVSLAAKAKEMNDRLYASVLSRAEP
jgi:GAF domain-containing protein